MSDGQAHWSVQFEKELEHLINCQGINAKVGCPDYVLARAMTTSLLAFDKALREVREKHSEPMCDHVGNGNPTILG